MEDHIICLHLFILQRCGLVRHFPVRALSVAPFLRHQKFDHETLTGHAGRCKGAAVRTIAKNVYRYFPVSAAAKNPLIYLAINAGDVSIDGRTSNSQIVIQVQAR